MISSREIKYRIEKRKCHHSLEERRVKCAILHPGNHELVEIKRTFTFSMGLILQLSSLEKPLCRRYLAWHLTYIIYLILKTNLMRMRLLPHLYVKKLRLKNNHSSLGFTPRKAWLQVPCSFYWDYLRRDIPGRSHIGGMF